MIRYARLLEARAGTLSAKLLGLAPTRVGDEEGPVVRDEDLADLERARRVLVLGDVGDDGLGDGLAEGVQLRGVTTARDAKADVDALERRTERGGRTDKLLEEEDRLVQLATQDRGAVQRQRDTVDLDQTLALLHAFIELSVPSRSLARPPDAGEPAHLGESHSGGGLLLAKGLDRLSRRHLCARGFEVSGSALLVLLPLDSTQNGGVHIP